jgi:ABC-type polysaccharide/polyol phosphate transport system ATPase subunit
VSTTIQFTGVSKKYHLGMTRISLPELVSGWTRSVIHRTKEAANGSRDFWALRDVSFDLQKGDSLALVGENGAGKTTILKLLANITKPTSGEIHVNGTLSALIELGAGFHPDLSGRENIFLNGTILGLKKDEIARRYDSIVDFAGLEKFIDTPVKRYSSGMAVRLGFAVAASIDPDILLVDEVLAVGDAAFRLKCMNRIQELINNGTTLVFVSHNMGLVKAVCQKALFIEKGVVREYGETSEVVEAYNRVMNENRISEFEVVQQTGKVHSSTCEITKVEISADTKGNDAFYSDKPATIHIQYRSYHDMGEVAIVLRVIRSDGVSCAVMYSKVDQTSLFIRQGTGEIDVSLNPLQLFPGAYYVAATIKNVEESMTHDLAYSDWFRVEGAASAYDDLDAVYEPNRVWSHQPESDGVISVNERAERIL